MHTYPLHIYRIVYWNPFIFHILISDKTRSMLPELFLKYSKVCRRLEARIDSEQKYEEEVDGYGMSLIFNNLEAGKLGLYEPHVKNITVNTA
jgi:hypothetical protein